MASFERLRELFEEHLRGLHRSRSYLGNVRLGVGDFAAFCQRDLGLQDPRLLQAKHLGHYIRSLTQRSLSPTSIYGRQRLLRTWTAWLTLQGCLLLDPFKDCHAKHPPHLPRAIPTLAQMQALLEAPQDPRDRALIEFLYGTGLRVGEVEGVDLEHLHLDRLELTVAHGKGSRTRLLPIGSRLAKILQDYLSHTRPSFPDRGCPALFLNRNGQRLTRNQVGARVAYWGKEAQIKSFSAHSIRHAFATHLLQNGAPIIAVQKLLGHATLSMTQRYTHLLQTDLAKELNRTHPRAKRARPKDPTQK